MPYYAQTSEFSCGPACVLMILKYFDPGLKINRSLEFEVWRQCNMIGVKGADPFGLSVPLLDHDYNLYLLTQARKTVDPDLWKSKWREHVTIMPADVDLAVFGVKENKKRALERGLNAAYGKVTVHRIAKHFQEGFIPLALVHMGVVHQLDIPHWVVVTYVGDSHVTFNDPCLPKGGKDIRVNRDEFQKMLGDVGPQNGLSPSVIFIRNCRTKETQTSLS